MTISIQTTNRSILAENVMHIDVMFEKYRVIYVAEYLHIETNGAQHSPPCRRRRRCCGRVRCRQQSIVETGTVTDPFALRRERYARHDDELTFVDADRLQMLGRLENAKL